MPTLGIIGSGNIGSAVARLAVAADLNVVIANSRGPQTLQVNSALDVATRVNIAERRF